MMKGLAIVGALFAPLAAAQGAAYAQCGGIGWTGATTCISGYSCNVINAYYSQCLPGAAATTTSGSGGSTPTSSGGGGSTTTNTDNPFSGLKQWANPYYASEVSSIAIPSLTASGKSAMATKAAAVAKVPSFTWLDTRAKVPSVQTYLEDIKSSGATNVIAPFVVYDLPDRDCAAAASNGELSIDNNGTALYKEYIDDIRAILVQYPDIPVVLIIEPDSLANLVTNLGTAKCSEGEATYKELIPYAASQLALDNVVMYLDGGHSGWLGWSANIGPAAELFGQMYTAAGSPSQLRGLATNVANYNGWSLSTCPSYTEPNTNCDEKRYINAIQPLLASNGWPNAHFIVDQGRSGLQPTGQIQQGDWCNSIGVGFGIRPDTTPDDPLLDAFVWVKPGGESDGTSNTSSTRYDFHCGQSDALQPAPEAGTWFEAMFEQLLTNANPAF